MAKYYITTTGSVPAAYQAQGYVLYNYGGGMIYPNDGDVALLAPDLNGTIQFSPPWGFSPHPFEIRVEQSNPNLTGIDVDKAAFRGDLVPTLTVADNVNISNASILFDESEGSNITLGQNVQVGAIYGSTESAVVDRLTIGDNSTTGQIALGDGPDQMILGDNVTVRGDIDLAGSSSSAGDTIVAGSGTTVQGGIVQGVGDYDSILTFGSNTTITGGLQLQGGHDWVTIGDTSSVGGTVSIGSGWSIRDDDRFIIGRNSQISGVIQTEGYADYVKIGAGSQLTATGINIDTGNGGDTLYLGAGVTTNGTVNMGLVGGDDRVVIEYGNGNQASFFQDLALGGFTDFDGDGWYSNGTANTSLSLDYFVDRIELVQGVPCFTSGTLIETADGPRPVDSLAVGDLVVTRDHGLQPLRWVGSRYLSAADLAANPKLIPIRIGAGALGPGRPARDLVVSPQHRIMIRSAIARRMFHSDEVLVPAVKLLGLPRIERAGRGAVRYLHLLFDRHEIVLSNGAETESLYTGEQALTSLGPEAREEILTLFPQLANGLRANPARPFVTGARAARLAQRHGRNRKALVGNVA